MLVVDGVSARRLWAARPGTDWTLAGNPTLDLEYTVEL